MLKVLPSELIKAADQYTIDHEPISSLDLMERAAVRAFERIKRDFIREGEIGHFIVFCGIGNNGGDGLVIARKLIEAGQSVELNIVQFSKNYSADFQANLKRLTIQPNFLTEESHEFELPEAGIVIDALFGTGLTREVKGFSSSIITKINEWEGYVISIDLPSGMYADKGVIDKDQVVIQSDLVLSFQFPKRSFLYPENAKYIKRWELIPIGIHKDSLDRVECSHFLIGRSDIRSILKEPMPFSHKGDRGRALLLAGSKGKVGAAVLAARACLRSGVGLLTLQAPQCAYTILQSTVPEAMVEIDIEIDHLSELKLNIQFDALGIGPGIGLNQATQTLMKLLIQECKRPMVIDADALNILSENKTWLPFLPAGSILSPHMKDFERLAGSWTSPDERMELLMNMAQKYKIYIVLKGKYSAIACPGGEVFFNSSGNPGMATGGSGDVLTGILSGLLAQGYSSMEAAIAGVYLHGLAGDLAAEHKGIIGMTASDIIDHIPNAYLKLTD